MVYTFKKGDVVVVKANTLTQAKQGYFVFWGSYPTMKNKYFKSRKQAVNYANMIYKRRK